MLTLFVPGQGHNGPGDWKQCAPSHKVWAMATKFLDFVPFYIWMVLEKSFMKFVFEIFEKLKKIFFDRRVPPLEKNRKYPKKIFFFQKDDTFSFWICILHILSFISRYITHMYVRFSNFELFLLEISYFLSLYFGRHYGKNCVS